MIESSPSRRRETTVCDHLKLGQSPSTTKMILNPPPLCERRLPPTQHPSQPLPAARDILSNPNHPHPNPPSPSPPVHHTQTPISACRSPTRLPLLKRTFPNSARTTSSVRPTLTLSRRVYRTVTLRDMAMAMAMAMGILCVRQSCRNGHQEYARRSGIAPRKTRTRNEVSRDSQRRLDIAGTRSLRIRCRLGGAAGI